MVCADDSPCGSVQAVEQNTANVEANEAAQAEAAQIDDCGWHGGCVMTTIRAYSSPSYAITPGPLSTRPCRKRGYFSGRVVKQS
jgi:hypothetical protein